MGKGQAALEFLTTYGWALIALVIVLGGLYLMFGFNPENSIPDSCNFGDSFNCIDAKIFKNGTVLLSVQNTVGLDVRLNSTICTHQGTKVSTSESRLIGAGEKFFISCDMDLNFVKKTKMDFTIIYVKKGYSYPSSADAIVVAHPMDS